MTSIETSNVKTASKKADIIAVLRKTCRELEARKRSLEELITVLEQGKDDIKVEDERLKEDADKEQHDGCASSSTKEAAEDSDSLGDNPA